MPSANIRQRYNQKTPLAHSTRITGRFAGINAANPTTIFGDGFTVARSGEGVWVVTFARPLAGFVSARAWAQHSSGYHEVSYALSAANRTLTITHLASAHPRAPVVVNASNLTDVAAADAATTNRSHATAPVAGTITKVQAQLISGGPLNAAAVITTNIGGTPITTGAITLPDTSAVGTVVAVTPTAANVVAIGDILTGVTDAGGSTTTAAALQYTITPTAPAAEDVVDEIGFDVTVAEADVIGAGV